MIINNKYKITDKVTGGVKMVGYKKSKWYECRERYNVVYPILSKLPVKHLTDALRSIYSKSSLQQQVQKASNISWTIYCNEYER